MKHRPAGFIIDVPITLSVAVRGTTRVEAKRIARDFAENISPTEDFIRGYSEASPTLNSLGATITEATLESPSDESCEVLDELEADNLG